MALLIQGSLAGSRMIQSYRESVQLAEEVKNIIVPAFEELMVYSKFNQNIGN